MQCHECGATISDMAADCPYCGTSVSTGDVDSTDGSGDSLGDRSTVIDEESATSTGGSVTGSTGRDATEGERSADTDYDEFGRAVDRADDDGNVDPADDGGNVGPADDGGNVGPDADNGNVDGQDGRDVDGDDRNGDDQNGDRHDDDRNGDVDVSADNTPDGSGRSPEVPSSSTAQSDHDSGDPSRVGDVQPDAERDDSSTSGSGATDESGPGVPPNSPTTGPEGEGRVPDDVGDGSVPDDVGERSVPDADGQAAGEVGGDADGTTDPAADRHESSAGGHGPASTHTPTGGQRTVDSEVGTDGTVTAGNAETVGGQDGAGDGSTAAESGTRDGDPTDEGFDPVAFVTGIPWLPSAVAGVATALLLFILSVLVAVVIPSVSADTLEFGAGVLFDLHFATPGHVTPLVFDNFEIVRPPDAALGLLYLLPPLFVYTASKAVVAFNVDDDRSVPFAALSGATLVVGYFPVVLVALFVAPPRTGGLVSVLGAVVIAGLVYPLLFGTIGGLFGGAYTGMERNVGTLYGIVTVFLVMVGAFVLSFPAFGNVVDVDLLSRVLLSLFTIVGANAFSLGGSGTNVAILLVYPLVAGAVFAAGFVRAFRAPDVESPVRGFAKGLTPAGTYVVVLGVLAAVLPVFADGYVQEQLGMGFGASIVIDSLVSGQLTEIGQYATVLVVGTLVYPVFLGGGAGALAGGIRYVLSD